MKLSPTVTSSPRPLARGITLIELAVVVAVLLLLVAVLAFSARAWKEGTERARCIMNIRQMQMSVRAYANLNNLEPGTNLGSPTPAVTLLGELVGPGKFVPELPVCPGNGMYFYGGDVIPEVGALYLSCSLAGVRGHEPQEFSDW